MIALFSSLILAATILPDAEEPAVAALVNAARLDRNVICDLCKSTGAVTDCSDWGPNEALAPLAWTQVASDAARFHAKHLHDGPCFQHDSCCELERAPDGSVRCKTAQCSQCEFPTECQGTGVGERYGLLGYAPQGVGENIAAGYANAFEVMCGWMDSDGHRHNILGDYDELGVGRFDGAAGCQSLYWTQAFGSRRDATGPGYITAGGLFRGVFGPPLGSGAGNTTALAYLHDASGPVAPKNVRVVVDGVCHGLTKAMGEDGRGLYAGTFDAAPGCHQVWLFAIDSRGGRRVFPQDGAMPFAQGNLSCPIPESRTTAACEGENACPVDGELRPCFTGFPVNEGKGVCHGGRQVCEQGAWSACRGEVLPDIEKCNGLDDDCDGRVDDNPEDAGASCSTGLLGRCGEGVGQCAAGGIVCVQARDAREETCNGEDDDCDGEPDDGFGDVSCGLGACRRITKRCENGSLRECVPGTPAPDEICGNGLDDDCDGTPDDGCECTGAQRPCYVGPAATKNKGFCREGVQRCVSGVWSLCEGQVLPVAETCNQQDDDCDGAEDEGFGREACGVGACRISVAKCTGGAIRTCTPGAAQAEICNGFDDSCNGDVDEGCTCRVGTTFPCATDWTHAGVGACKAGVRACRPDGSGFADCTGEVLPTAEICGNGLDEDCDGVADDGCPPPTTKPKPKPAEADDSRGGCASAGGTAFAIVALLRRRAIRKQL